MKNWLRQHRYALVTSLRRFATQPFSTLTNLLVITLILTVPLVGAALLFSLQPLTRQVSTQPQLTVFLTPDLSAKVAESVLQQIRQQAAAENFDVRWVPRDLALQQLRAQSRLNDALDSIPGNPLPDAIVVTLKGSEPAEQAARLARTWHDWPGVDAVQLDDAWIRRLQGLLGAVRVGLTLLGIGVALIVLATVFNTVRLQALAQREEITVARLVGATESFVRRPFLYQGALAAGVAAVLAIALAALTLVFLNQALSAVVASYHSSFTLHLPAGGWLLAFVVLAGALGAFSARWSVTRNTRF